MLNRGWMVGRGRELKAKPVFRHCSKAKPNGQRKYKQEDALSYAISHDGIICADL